MKLVALFGKTFNFMIEQNIEQDPLYLKMKQFVKDAFANVLYGGHPYTFHTSAVERVLMRYGADLTTVLAGGLHDTKEDLGTTEETLVALFGQDVADIVEKVTDRPGKNRSERHQNTYPIIRTCPKAVMVKLADRIANMSYCLKNPSHKSNMYVKEYPYFKSILHQEGEYPEMWQELDQLNLKLSQQS